MVVKTRCLHARGQERSQAARSSWEDALAAKDRAIAQLEGALASERAVAEQARATAAGAASQAQAKSGAAGAAEAALADARRELERLRQQARKCTPHCIHELCTTAGAARASMRVCSLCWAAPHPATAQFPVCL